jgi:hypothetical protein
MLAAVIRFWRSSVCRFVLLGAFLFFFGLELFGLRLFGAGIDPVAFGDLASWAQSIATVAAVIVALRQISHERLARLADLERSRIRERTQVYCWLTFKESEPVGWYLYFNNLTPAPINTWVLRVFEEEDGNEPLGTFDGRAIHPILPGFSERRTLFDATSLTRPRCRLDFVDAVGRCWRRSSDGDLDPIDEVRLGDQLFARSTVDEGARGRMP